MTQRLYDNGHIKEFEAVVAACNKSEKGYEVILDKTAFFPNGGGQLADGGTINGIAVLDVNEKGTDIVHTVEKEIAVGSTVYGAIDWETRFNRMQNHTGEHIVCGVAHRLYGCENTGFHMGTFGITCDLSVLLNEEQIRKIETEANRAVFENVPVTVFYPDKEELNTIDYRSKLDLTENVRLVRIEGYDLCACCAPHVLNTGEVGLIKILEHYSHRGGTRLLMKCGWDALKDYNEKCRSVAAVSASLCAKQNEIAQAVETLKAEKAKLDYELEAIKLSQLNKYINRLQQSENNVCVFADEADSDGLREIVNKGKELCTAIFAAFSADATGYKYCIGSNSVDLRGFAKEFNSALNGRGGGRPEMIQGSVAAEKEKIIAFLNATEM
ncbi:MAG: hypothetical protein IKK85_02965 [Clostridia bacterium]|nr:hypothetical protein [Clostridia bacterium]